MTYFQRRMADKESGVDISEQEQKWCSTVLIFLNTFQILEKKIENLEKKPQTFELKNHYRQLERSVMWTTESAGHQQTACRINSSLPTSPARYRVYFPMLARLLLSRDGTRAAALISSAVIFLEFSRVFLLFFFFSFLTEKHVMLFNVTSHISHHFNFFQGEPSHTETHNATQ